MSKVVLYMAVSVDGFVAGANDETPWSDEEWKSYKVFIASCDVCLVGSTTYKIMNQSADFVEGVQYIVLTNDATADTGSFEKRAINSVDDMPQAEKIGVIGGGELNGRLMELGVIDEIILDVEPVVLGQGIKLFGEHEVSKKLRLISSKKLGDNGIQNHYEVMK